MVLAGGTTVVDEYDPTLGILLGQDLDFHYNRFQMSLYVTVLPFKDRFLTSGKQCKSASFPHFKIFQIDRLSSFGVECERQRCKVGGCGMRPVKHASISL